jgi:hypothetical protein
VGKYFPNDCRVFDAGNDAYISPALIASFTKSRCLQAISMLKTRFKRFAHVIEARFSPGVWSASSAEWHFLFVPRLAGVTSARYLLLGVNTP